MDHRTITPSPQRTQVSAVLLNCFADDHSLPFVVPDEIQGGSTVTETLLKNGHCRIDFISNSDPTPVTAGLFEGHRHALAAHGVPFDAKLVAAPSRTEGDGYRSTQVLMQQPARPTALFSTNDVLAMDAYAVLQSLHLAIPNDGAVLGRDPLGRSLTTCFRPCRRSSVRISRWHAGRPTIWWNMPRGSYWNHVCTSGMLRAFRFEVCDVEADPERIARSPLTA